MYFCTPLCDSTTKLTIYVHNNSIVFLVYLTKLFWIDVLLYQNKDKDNLEHYDPFIHQQFRESNIQAIMLPPKGHEANQTELFQAVVQRNVRKWQAPGRRAENKVQQLFQRPK